MTSNTLVNWIKRTRFCPGTIGCFVRKRILQTKAKLLRDGFHEGQLYFCCEPLQFMNSREIIPEIHIEPGLVLEQNDEMMLVIGFLTTIVV